MFELFKYQFKEKYNSDLHFADNLTPKYKEFELKYNELLKEKYPSFTDEMKRQMWVSRKIKLNIKDLKVVTDGIKHLIGTNFENVSLITDNNSYLVKYLIEKKTGEIYKVKSFNSCHYHYATVGEKTILNVQFDIKYGFFKKNIIVKYSQGYLSESAFTFVTYGETKQIVDAKLQFDKQAKQIVYKIENYFGLDRKDDH
jgi:hypothetical protein